jgi:hypothetical protein
MSTPAATIWDMVNPALMEQVAQLSAAELVELRDAIDARLGEDEPSAEMLAIVEERLAELGPGPSPTAISWDELKRRLDARRSA